MPDLYEQLNDLYQLQAAAKELSRGIKKGGWKIFEPSRFVYAFFAFNSFYSINWEESAKIKELVKWELNKNGVRESQKTIEMSKFLLNVLDDPTLRAVKRICN